MKVAQAALDHLQDKPGLRVIDIPGSMNQRRQVWGCLHQEPGVHADAVSTHTRTRIQNFHPRVPVCQADRLPNIHAKPVCQPGKFVGNGNIDIPVSIFHQLDHLCGGGIRQDDFPAHKGGIQITPCPGRCLGDTTDNAGVFHQFPQDLPG